MKFKKNIILLFSFLFFCNIFGLSIQSIDVSKTIDIRNLEISWANGINNNVMVINFGNDIKYFRECKKKLEIHDEVKRIIDSYFDEYLNDKNLSLDKKLLSQTLLNKENFEKFITMVFLCNSKSNLSQYVNNQIDSSYVGIPEKIIEKLQIDLIDFLKYASRELVQRLMSNKIENNELQTCLTVRQLATYKIAKYLGVKDIITKTKFVKLITNTGEKFGNIIEQAPGDNIYENRNNYDDLKIIPDLQRQLNNLQVLDNITRELDHNPGNCMFKVNDDKIVNVTAFDNEGCFGINTDLKVNTLCWGKISPLITSDNKINLPIHEYIYCK